MKINKNNKIVKISKVKPNKYNPKPDFSKDKELYIEFEKIKKSLKFHGQIDPLQVREIKDDYELINGYHRFIAMKELGFEEVEIKNFGKISKERAIKIALSMEELQIPLDVLETAKLIKEMKDANKSLDGLPYLEKEIEEKVKLLEFDWNEIEKNDDVISDGLKIEIKVTKEQKINILKVINSVVDKKRIDEGKALEEICINYEQKP